MIVNGKSILLDGNMTLKEYLEASGYMLSRVAVEHNGVIISKSDYAQVTLKNNDCLEIVQFVGGG